MRPDLHTDPRLDREPDSDPRDSEFPVTALLPPAPAKLQHSWQVPHLFTQYGGDSVEYAIAHHLLAAPHGRHLAEVTDLLGRRVLGGGTSLRAGVKRAVTLGFYTSYYWADNEQQVADAVANLGPMLLGCSFFEDMQEPGLTGLISPTGDQVGGACLLISAINMRTGLYRLHTSFGPQWGHRSSCYLTREHLALLLTLPGGEACLPVKTR